jgi:hypothetical protein
MRAMGGDAIPPELYKRFKGFLDRFTTTHEECGKSSDSSEVL